MKYLKYCIILIIVLLQGCQFLDSSKGPYPATGIADDGLKINFQEHHSNYDGSNPELYLNLRTEKQYPCANYSINNKILITSTHVDIYMIGVHIGPMCLTAFGPANALIPFSEFQGKKVLEIWDGNLSNQFEISVTREKVDIKPIISTFTNVSSTRYYRKPENSFHFDCRTPHNAAHLCQDFHQILMNELDLTEFNFPNDGFNFYNGEDGGYIETHRFQVSRFYTYTVIDDFHRAGELLESFTHERIEKNQGQSLSIYNWRNTGYRSWSFQNQ
jgi:hypothetical protein